MQDDRARARLSRARAASSPTELTDLYRDWADHYDHDLLEVLGVTGSHRIADLLAEHLPDRHAAVLDVGCGTGIVGQRLAAHGFDRIDGVDLSPEMLAVAGTKGCYRTTTAADLLHPQTLPAGPFAALVSAGTFTSGHVGADAVAGLIERLAPGGWCAWVIAEGLWPSFAAALADHGVTTVSATLEPIRRDGPPESVMYLGRR